MNIHVMAVEFVQSGLSNGDSIGSTLNGYMMQLSRKLNKIPAMELAYLENI